MNEICNKKDCTGCGLCIAQCPHNCISIHTGVMGHVYPIIDHSRCTDCGLCRKKCPANTVFTYHKPVKAFATWSKDYETYKMSASGGIATEIARYIILSGGAVYGCASLPDIKIKHIRIDNVDDLPLLQGSKYVQSDIVSIIRPLKEDIKVGKPVCFIGTPCLVAAIRNIYKDKPDNLYLIDLICHGVPSIQELRKHIRRIAGKNRIDHMSFRKQNQYGLYLFSSNKVIYSYDLFAKRFQDSYMNPFMDAFNVRDSCYRCKYARPERISDMTIGDFWGLGDKYPAEEIPEHEIGCSVALPSTEKGMFLLDKISRRLNLYERPLQEAIDGNAQLQHPFFLNRRIRIYRNIQHLGYMPWAYHLLVSDIILWPKVRGLFRKIKRLVTI